MVKCNKIILISLLLFAIISLGVVSATDDINSTDVNSELTVQTTSDIDDCLTIEDAKMNDEISEVGSNNGQNDEILSEVNAPILISNKTFTDYFDSEGKLLDSVAEGSILDFQGSIEASDSIKSIYINKPVSIVSSSGDAVITLNTLDGTLGKESIAGRFVVDGVSSITIKDVVFNRTQMLIQDSNNVVLNNISLISDNYRIISTDLQIFLKTPFLKLDNINGFILKDSYFHVNNIGSSIIGCDNIKEVVFDNNIFNTSSDDNKWDKKVFRVISFSDYVDTNVTVTNNKFLINYSASSAVFDARHILFENNTVEYAGILPDRWTSFGIVLNGSANSDIIVRNNNLLTLSVDGVASIYNNIVSTGNFASGCIAYNNTFNGVVHIKGSDVIVKDSTFHGLSVTVKVMKNVTVENNNISGQISISSIGQNIIQNNTINGNILINQYGVSELYNNIIYGSISIGSSSSIVRNNVIYASSSYAISISKNKKCINNEISNNKIYSKFYCGNNAISYDKMNMNIIEENTPIQIDLHVNTTIDTFDYDGNTTIVVRMFDVEGDVTIDVDGQKYVVRLVNGSASQILTKYAVGINNVTAIYEDTTKDVWAINHTTFTVNKVSYCPVELVYGNAEECKSTSVKVILPSDANGTILLTITNGVYTNTIEQDAIGRENIIQLYGLFKGDYSISATFVSVKYVTNTSSGNISFVHIPTYKLTAGAVVMDYNDGSKYKVLVTKDGKAVGAGEVVKITFNGVTKNVKTDKKGYATLTLNAAPKTYTIKATYNGATKSSKVTIKNILKASNISKKKAKKIKFSATLKTSKGKAIAGKKITFKFKGKTYTAKTNKKGVATITLKNLKVGKYTITSKYGSCTVKNTIKIKK